MDVPQLYLVTPPEPELSGFSRVLSGIVDVVDIACLRLSLATQDEDRICRMADHLRELVHARDIPIIIDSHARLVARLGLDGVHLGDGARSIRATRKELGGDVIVGSFCGDSRHEGMNAGESGADYICFGPVSPSALGVGQPAEPDLFDWWSEVIEVPVVAEGAMTVEAVERLAPVTDFFAIGPEIWTQDDPLAALRALLAPIH